jgi:hypothetical protein
MLIQILLAMPGVYMADSQTIPPSDRAAVPNGAAWAALLAAGLGGFAFGAITDLSECLASVGKLLIWYRPAGALSGVAISAIVIWLGVWIALHTRWNGKRIEAQGMLVAVISLLAIAAVVTTFPPFYEMLGG